MQALKSEMNKKKYKNDFPFNKMTASESEKERERKRKKAKKWNFVYQVKAIPRTRVHR